MTTTDSNDHVKAMCMTCVYSSQSRRFVAHLHVQCINTNWYSHTYESYSLAFTITAFVSVPVSELVVKS